MILDLDDVNFIEPNYERLADNSYTAKLLTKAEEARMLISEDEWPLAVALKTATGWIAGSFILRKPTEAVIEKVESLEGDVLQDERSEWEAAVREYYSLALLATVQPAMEDFNPRKSVADLRGTVGGRSRARRAWTRAAVPGRARWRSARRHDPNRFDNDPRSCRSGCTPGWSCPRMRSASMA